MVRKYIKYKELLTICYHNLSFKCVKCGIRFQELDDLIIKKDMFKCPKCYGTYFKGLTHN